MKERIYLLSPTDRDAVVQILARNGYTVRQGKEKQGNKSILYVEYWMEGKGQ